MQTELQNEVMKQWIFPLGSWEEKFISSVFWQEFHFCFVLLSWFFPSQSKFLAGTFIFLASRIWLFILNLKTCLAFNVSVWVTVEYTKVGLALEAVGIKPSLGSLWCQQHPTEGLFRRVSAGLLKQELRFLSGVFKIYCLTCIKLRLWHYLSVDQMHVI